MVQDGRIGLSRLGNRRLLLGRLLRAFAVLCLAIACLPYYAEARFSVATTSYATAGVNNPFIRLWNDAEGEWRSALHFGLWVVVSFAFAFAGIALSAAELLDREQPAAAADSPARFRRLRWHLNHSKGSLALVFVLLYSVAIAVGHSTDRLGGRFHWGAAPYWNAEKHGRFIGYVLSCSAFYAGYGGLLPMTLIGIPLSRTSALWRAMGRSYEEAIAFHRALGHVMMALYTYHGVGYMVYWLIRGIDVFVEEMTDWLDCGKCTHINNLAGVISWAGGFLLWLTSLKWARRKNYALFFTTHQLHLVFFGFGCIHWPTCLAYAAPSIVFYAADLALRMHISRKGIEAIARVRPSLKEPTMTTLVIARSGDAPTAPRPADCPHGVEMVAKSASGTCPAKGSRANETPDDGEDWSGGCVYLAVPKLGRLPYLQWHPFSIGGSADNGESLIVHVRKCKGWTKRLPKLAAKPAKEAGSARTARGDVTEREEDGDRQMRVRVIGPIPAPPALLDCVSEVSAGVPLFLLGGGSGIVPLVAILRRLAYGRKPLPQSASVHLVLVVREACAIEQLLDGRFLPIDGASGETGYSWLRTEIYLTAKRKTPQEGDGEGPASSSASERASTQLEGPFTVEVDDDEQLSATAAPFAPLDGKHTEPTGVPIQVYEGASLLGAAIGFTVIAWPLIWRSSEAPWARRNASTSTTGGGGFLLALAVACILSALLLRICDWVSRLHACLRRRGPTQAAIKAIPASMVLDDERMEVAEDGGSSKGGRGDGTEGIDLSITPSVSSSSSSGTSSGLSVPVPLAGRTRPDVGKLLQSTPHGARVAVGGPPSMVNGLAKELKKARRAPSVCLTTQM